VASRLDVAPGNADGFPELEHGASGADDDYGHLVTHGHQLLHDYVVAMRDDAIAGGERFQGVRNAVIAVEREDPTVAITGH